VLSGKHRPINRLFPLFLLTNELLIVSDGWDALCGTVTSDWGRFMSWKTKDGRTTADNLQPQMEVMFTGMLNKQTLLDLIHHFIVFEKSKDKTLKKVAAYHQYYAVNKAVTIYFIAACTQSNTTVVCVEPVFTYRLGKIRADVSRVSTFCNSIWLHIRLDIINLAKCKSST